MRSGSGAVLVPLLTMGASADSARLRVTRVAGIVIAVPVMGYCSVFRRRSLSGEPNELLLLKELDAEERKSVAEELLKNYHFLIKKQRIFAAAPVILMP